MLTDLIERLEKEGGSRELDAEIFRALDYQLPDEFASKKISLDWRPDGSAMMEVGDMVVSYNPPPFTQSLDAAIALCERVLPDPFWGLHTNRVVANVYHADVGTRQPHRTWLGSADIPATALCIALLRALEDGK